jgi:histidinol-phosphate aminotransferase
LYRIFCEPKKDKVIICPPTYGMYEVSANINDVEIHKVSLLSNFEPDVEHILESNNANARLLFLCSPNNPTGNSLHADDMELLISKFPGMVVVDEAYINYSRQPSLIRLLAEYPNLVILQTFSKAWGLAALRLGMAFASQTVIDYMNKVKPPYNVNQSTQQLAAEALDNIEWVNQHIRQTVQMRGELEEALKTLAITDKIYPSDANFLLVKVTEAKKIYDWLIEKSIVVRDRSKVAMCEGCLRITIGTKQENDLLMSTLKDFRP